MLKPWTLPSQLLLPRSAQLRKLTSCAHCSGKSAKLRALSVCLIHLVPEAIEMESVLLDAARGIASL